MDKNKPLDPDPNKHSKTLSKTQPVVQSPVSSTTSNIDPNLIVKSQLDEVINLCKSFHNNMQLLNANQSDIKIWISNQETKDKELLR